MRILDTNIYIFTIRVILIFFTGSYFVIIQSYFKDLNNIIPNLLNVFYIKY